MEESNTTHGLMSSSNGSKKRPRDVPSLAFSAESIITKKHFDGDRRIPLQPSQQLVSTNQRPVTPSISVKQSVATTDGKNAVDPVTFLRSILKDVNTQPQNSSYDGSFFSKPSEEEISAYDLQVVNAIRASDIHKLRTLHKEGKSLNACNRFGESLLHMCCRRGDAQLVKFLVQEIGVRINVKDDYGRTPLHDACWTTRPNFEIMDIFLEASHTDLLLAVDVRGHTPFDYARKEHWGAWVQFFHERMDMLQAQRAN